MENGVQVAMSEMNIKEKKNCNSYEAKQIKVEIVEIDGNKSLLSIGQQK